jgi:hypothetical protein
MGNWGIKALESDEEFDVLDFLSLHNNMPENKKYK